MSLLIVPPIEDDESEQWPSLGEQVAEWLEEWAVFGPGSKKGQPVTVDDAFFDWLQRAYQVFPKGHQREGRRRFKLAAEEMPKGVGKTEHAIIIAQAEFHPSAPVRTAAWTDSGDPIGGGVIAPRLLFFATSEDQAERTAFGRLVVAMKLSELADDYNITNEKIILLGEHGEAAGTAEALPISAGSADGDLPTYQHFDEPHRWIKRAHHEMFHTTSQNLLKDVDADAWIHTTSTAGLMGQKSVEEETLMEAEAIDRGELDQPTMFFMRRFAPEDMPLETIEDAVAFVTEARGPASEWSGDIPAIAQEYFRPRTDRMYWRRVWGNQWQTGEGRAFDPKIWNDELARPGLGIENDRLVTVGFDGARKHDSTGFVVTDVESGHQIVFGLWERPHGVDEWTVPQSDVDNHLIEIFDRWNVWRVYGDPPYWQDMFPVWAARWGDERIIEWWTNRYKAMAYALQSYRLAQVENGMTHDGHDRFAAHIANSYRKELPSRDENEEPLWTIQKERPDSPNKIDLAMCGCLSWEARQDAITAGALNEEPAGRGGWAF